MPVILETEVRQATQIEFGEVAYAVMRHVFDIHRDFGRFFDERIYKQELAQRMTGVELEVPIEVRFDVFRKLYFLDVLVANCAAFEFKSVEALNGRHRAQLCNYLLLCDLCHGKLINVRPEEVEHEFVNTQLALHERTSFSVDSAHYVESSGQQVRQWFTDLVCDLGTGLSLSLYEDALTQFLGGEERVIADVPVVSRGVTLGTQRFRLIAPGVAFKVTALEGQTGAFKGHAMRLLTHAALDAIQWINVSRDQVTFRTLRRI